MCLLKKENKALREQIEAMQRAIDLQKSKSILKAKQDGHEIQKLRMNAALLTAMIEKQTERLDEQMPNVPPVTILEEAVPRYPTLSNSLIHI